jgi:hypothetical protein
MYMKIKFTRQILVQTTDTKFHISSVKVKLSCYRPGEALMGFRRLRLPDFQNLGT